MATRIYIGSSERDLGDVEPGWVNEQIKRRKSDGLPVCVKIVINTCSANLVLSTADCPKNAVGGRSPNAFEKKLWDWWDQLHLNEDDFQAGNLIAFLQRLRP